MKRRTTLNLMMVTAGRVGPLMLWFIAYVLLIRHLGASEAGIFMLCLMFIRVVGLAVGEPLDLAVMRRVPQYLKTDRSRGFSVMQAALLLRITVGASVLLLACILSRPIATELLKSPNYAIFVVLAAIGGLGELLFRFVLSYFQAAESFGKYMAIETTLQVSRFVAILGLVWFDKLSLIAALGVYVFISYAVFAVGVALLPTGLMRLSVAGRKELSDLFHYSKWIALALLIAALYEKLDLFMLGKFDLIANVGLYGAALQFAMLPDILTSCLATVFYPKIVTLYERNEFQAVLRKYLRFAVPLSVVAMAGVMLIGGKVFVFFLGEEYSAAISALKILSAGTLFWLVVSPLPMGLVALKRPKQILMVTSTQMIFMVAGSLMLIKPYGIIGAATLILAARVVFGSWLFLLGQKIVRDRAQAMVLDPSLGVGLATEPISAISQEE